MDKPTVHCESTIAGDPGTDIEMWKFHTIRRVIMRVLEGNEAGVLIDVLPDKVQQIIADPQTRSNIGFIPWYTQIVQMDLETKGVIELVPEEDTQRVMLKSG